MSTIDRKREAERALMRWENCRDRVAAKAAPTAMQLAMQRARDAADRRREAAR